MIIRRIVMLTLLGLLAGINAGCEDERPTQPDTPPPPAAPSTAT